MAKELRESDGNKEMMESFKSELSDIELRLRNGGLGGVDGFEDWENKLMEATDVQTMVSQVNKFKPAFQSFSFK